MARFYGYAAHDRTGELAKVLIDAGADKDDETKNGSPLMAVLPRLPPRRRSSLLAAGADVEHPDDPPDTALRLAAAFGFPTSSTSAGRRHSCRRPG